jgi:asparagine synthase (glutamine-hydrolysing)
MCGICGIFQFDRVRSVDPEVLEAMNRRIVHRGPDDAGYRIEGNVGLAMRRLSIVDLQTGHQPISNEDGTVWIVYNGEIYNHDDLRKGLEAHGHVYRTRSDTETIIHLYEEYGADCVKYLRGMFAFAIWDANRRRLFVARDRVGIKPLYYIATPELFLFASEIKALLAYPSIKAQLNRDLLPEYLTFGYVSGPGTLFAGIEKLLPGHTVEVSESGHCKTKAYWDVPEEDSSGRSRQFYVETYREMLEEAVKGHLMSDVPLGVFLSGGVDSSAIAALMTKARKEPIETFSVGYTENEFSELGYARTVAKHLGSVHHEVQVSRADFFDALPRMIWQEDEPLSWPASVPLYFVSRLARERVKVVLTGEGSDETLAGYGRYMWTLWNARFDGVYRKLVPELARTWLRNGIAHGGWIDPRMRQRVEHTFLGRDGNSWASLFFDNFYAAFSAADQKTLLLNGESSSFPNPYRECLEFWEHSKGDLLARMLYTDMKTYLVELCMKQDQMSMAASIESRVPFLDHQVVEFAARIPSRFKTRGLDGKLILKEGIRDLLPSEIIHRKKVGFSTPLAAWLRGPQLDYVQSVLLDPRASERDLFNMQTVKTLLDENRTGERNQTDRIWRLLNLELWHRVFIDGDVPSLETVSASSEKRDFAVRLEQ